MLWQKGESAVTIRELCEKEVVQLEQGVCLGRADDLEFDPATAQLQSLILLGRPRFFGLLGRDESLTIPWREIETIGTDAILGIPPCQKHRQHLTASGSSCVLSWVCEK